MRRRRRQNRRGTCRLARFTGRRDRCDLAGYRLPRGLGLAGPGDRAAAFRSRREVLEAFLASDPGHFAAFTAHGPGKWLADIYQLARRQLAGLGVERVFGGDYCTVADPARFYSYRGDGATTGRMASLIWRVS
nr:laccase domain-containing protein [Methylomonas koyamae]